MSVFTRTSACWYMIYRVSLGFCCLCATLSLNSSQGAPRKDTGRWRAPAGSHGQGPIHQLRAESSTQLQGGCLGRTHKHKVPTDRSTLNTHAKAC